MNKYELNKVNKLLKKVEELAKSSPYVDDLTGFKEKYDLYKLYLKNGFFFNRKVDYKYIVYRLLGYERYVKERIKLFNEFSNLRKARLSFLKHAIKLTGSKRKELFDQFKKMEELKKWFNYPNDPWEDVSITYYGIPENNSAPDGHLSLIKEAIPKIKNLIKVINLKYLKYYDYAIYYRAKLFVDKGLFMTMFGKFPINGNLKSKPLNAISLYKPPTINKPKLNIEQIIKNKITELTQDVEDDLNILKKKKKYLKTYKDVKLKEVN